MPTHEGPFPSDRARVEVAGIVIEWDLSRGTCKFADLPMAMMWVESTLAGLMTGVQAMVGTERFLLALQAEGRRGIDADWQVIEAHADFHEGFRAIANIAAVAGWGRWSLEALDTESRTCRIRVVDGWEGRFQRALGVRWGSGVVAGKFAGYVSRLFGTNCWADQTAFIAAGAPWDEFMVRPSDRTIESGIAGLLSTDAATRADMAVALQGLKCEIAERARVEAALRVSEEKYRGIFDESVTAIFAFDTRKRFIDSNQAGLDLLGYGRDELLRMSIPDVDADPVVVLPAHQELLAGGKLINYEHRLRRKDGAVITVLNNSRPLTGADGVVVGMLSTLVDISERKRAEDDRRRLEAELRLAQKMESVGRLAGGVAHDFNNMLGVILGRAELALAAIDEGHPLVVHLRGIEQAARRSANLTRQLLAFASRQTMDRRVVDLNDLIVDISSMLRQIIGENIRLGWTPGAGLWPVCVDPSQIDQILTNLCVNSRDAISGCGRIDIATGNRTLEGDRRTAPAEVAPGDYVWLRVTDNGCGLEPEQLEHIFEPFYTTKPTGVGTGLGLATVYGVVRQNGGFVRVESTPGLGTAFTIHLPRHRGASPQTPEAPAGVPVAKRGRTILLVEDEADLLHLVAGYLQGAGHVVLAFREPAAALRAMREYSGELHLLITDVIMPGMSGRDLVRALAATRPDLRHIYMSGYAASVIGQHGVLEEGEHFLQKPFSLESLSAKIGEVLADHDPAS